jgi:hypothetical protein
MWEYVLSLTASRIPIKAKSMADVRIWVNMMTESTESSSFTILRHKQRVNILLSNWLLSHLEQEK